jgi:UDP-2,4-diacetamido-2,4,6-trideoxy-beta-L-altropyranose hydrolase
MKRILFRADGNSEVGLGHLYRIFALVELFKKEYDVVLVTSAKTTVSAIPADYCYALIPEAVSVEQEPGWLQQHYPATEYRIVADGYQFNEAWQRYLKANGYHLTYIDDFCREHMYADVLINHSLAARASDYKTERYTKLALGTKYAILRPSFLEAAKQARETRSLKTAFVCFGGADPFDLTLKATQALLAFSEIMSIHIVVGAAYAHRDIFALKASEKTIQVHQNLSEKELVTLMKACDFAIASSSTILYELCSVKMPVLSGYYVENQKGLYQGCLDHQLIFGAGNLEYSDTEDFKEKIKTVLEQPDYSTQMEAQAAAFDAQIKERFLELFREISYRRANAEDVLLIYEWANDPVSRENSYFTEAIPLETHKAWFTKKLADPASMIFIAEVNGEPAGMLRYDLLEDHAVVGISVAERFRGKGLAPEFLKDTAKLYFEKHRLPVEAFIKKQNLASVKSFEKAGYKKTREETVHGADSFIYTLE